MQPNLDEAGFSYLTAYVVASDELLTLTGLRAEMARHLAPFMIPEFFVRMGELPLNPNGKPDRKALPVVMKAGPTDGARKGAPTRDRGRRTRGAGRNRAP